MSLSLYEEYLKRKGIDVPVIKYNYNSGVFLRKKNSPYRWRYLGIRWNTERSGPGYFTFNYVEAVHNGYNTDRYFDRLLMDAVVAYTEDYESRVAEVVNDIRENDYIATDVEEQVLSAWSFTMVICDSYLSQRMSPKFFKLVADSLSLENNLYDRKKAFIQAERMMTACHHWWTNQILPLARYDSEWLIKLINE